MKSTPDVSSVPLDDPTDVVGNVESALVVDVDVDVDVDVAVGTVEPDVLIGPLAEDESPPSSMPGLSTAGPHADRAAASPTTVTALGELASRRTASQNGQTSSSR